MKKAITYIAVFVLGVVLSAGVQTVYGAEKHPHIRTAIRELAAAKNELEHAAHDFGGHRAAAVRAVSEAQVQLQEALRYDK
jgi:outer membrane murein-binding lipoprotein Lpp